MKTYALGLLLMSVGLAACTPGQSEFSCKGYPDGVSCLSARQVYELTNSRSRLHGQDLERSEAAVSQTESDARPPAGLTAPAGSGADPNAAGPQAQPGVLRAWVAPWQTGDGDVVAASYVFTRVESPPSPPTSQDPRLFEPLKGQSQAVHEVAGPVRPAGDLMQRVAAIKNEPNIVRLAEILFERGSAEVTSGGVQRLQEAVARAATLRPKSVHVTGFTDRLGSDEANLRLSERRIESVVRILKQHEISASFVTMPKGETMLPHPTEDGVSDPHNRKVWVWGVDVQAQPADGEKIVDIPANLQLEPAVQPAAAIGTPANVSKPILPNKPERCLRPDPDDHGANERHDHRRDGSGHG